MTRKIKNGYVSNINLIVDELDNLVINFVIRITNSLPLETYQFKKREWDVSSIKKLMTVFFNVRSWEEITLVEIRLMFEDGILRAIGKMNEELWFEIYPWDLMTEIEK